MPTTDIDIEEVRSLYEVNVFGVMRMCKAFIHLLIASGDGKIINHGSIAGIIPVTFSSVYNSSKAALAQYSDTLRIEVAPLGVKVITVSILVFSQGLKRLVTHVADYWRHHKPHRITRYGVAPRLSVSAHKGSLYS